MTMIVINDNSNLVLALFPVFGVGRDNIQCVLEFRRGPVLCHDIEFLVGAGHCRHAGLFLRSGLTLPLGGFAIRSISAANAS